MIPKIKAKLEKNFPGAIVKIKDTSAGHAGHFEHEAGVHLAVSISWSGFAGKSLVEQHKMVYKVLHQELQGMVHALQLKTTP